MMIVLELREQVLEVSAARFDARLESFAERQHSLLYDFQWQTVPDDLQRCFQLGDIPRPRTVPLVSLKHNSLHAEIQWI